MTIVTIATSSTPLIHPESGDYPVYLGNLVKYAPNTSFGPAVGSDTLLDFGLWVVYPTDAPQDDVVTEGYPVLIDGDWHQAWISRSYSDAEKAERLTTQKEMMLEAAENLRLDFFTRGFPYTFPNGQVYHVQVRAADRSNISDLRIVAKEAIAEGKETTFEFRTFENISVTMTAAELVDMSNATFTQVQNGYKAIWVYKDEITAAATMAALPVTPTEIFTALNA